MSYSLHLFAVGFGELVSEHGSFYSGVTYTLSWGAADIFNLVCAASDTRDFDITKIEFYNSGAWEDKTSDTYWTAGSGGGTWDGTKWVAAGAPSRGVTLDEKGSWNVGYRPTKIRLTCVGSDILPPVTPLSGSGTSKIVFTEESIWEDSGVVWADGDVDWYTGTKYPHILMVSAREALTWTISYVYPSAAVAALQPKVTVIPRRM